MLSQTTNRALDEEHVKSMIFENISETKIIQNDHFVTAFIKDTVSNFSVIRKML